MKLMTSLLDEVVKQISQLPAEEQDEIAKMILSELKWKKSFISSSSRLEALAEEALKDFAENKTTPLEF